MDDNREERGGATDGPGGATPAGTPRPLTRRELRLAQQAQEAAPARQPDEPQESAPARQPDEPQESAQAPPTQQAARVESSPSESSRPEGTSTEPVPGESAAPHAARAIGQLARAGHPDAQLAGTGRPEAADGARDRPPAAAPRWAPVRAEPAQGMAAGFAGLGSLDGTASPERSEHDGAWTPPTRRRAREAVREAVPPSQTAALPGPAAPTVPAEEVAAPASDEPSPAPSPALSPAPSSAPSPQPLPQHGPPAGADPLRSRTLPTVLPEEPDVDDVRWEGPVPPVDVVRTPVTRRAVPRVAPPPDDVGLTGPVPLVRPADGRVDPAPVPTPAMSFGPTWTVRGPAAPAAVGPEPPAGAAGAVTRGAGPVGTTPLGGGPDRVERVASAVPHPGIPERPGTGDGLPTLDDLLASRPRPAEGPAELGWRAVVRRATGGMLALAPGPEEQRVRESVAAVQRPLAGPRTVVVINPKGGAHKTTATLLLAATFGGHRGRSTLAWDNNETRGTLGWRSEHGVHQRTAVDLLDDLHRFEDPSSGRVGDLDAYVRAQSAQFDVLASDEDAASAASIDAFAFRSLHRTLQRFYRVLVVDTGNNMRASNWQAAIEAADQVVVVSTVREDTSQSAAWALDALRAAGKEDVVRRAVTVLSDPATRRDAALHQRLHDHFGRLTRVVLDVPYDPALVSGGPLDVDRLSRQTREAWLHVAAAVADGL